MARLQVALQLIGRLLSYPGPETVVSAGLLCDQLTEELSGGAADAIAFRDFVQSQDKYAMEEHFTQVFDMTADCALEVGWHLFGEDYSRGLFLVRVREEMRKYGLTETAELPDHICHVLAIATAMPAEEATRFACACVLPAIRKMNEAISKSDTPYRYVVSCLDTLLTFQWGGSYDAAKATEQAAVNAAAESGQDLLHAFPIRDVDDDGMACESGSCCSMQTDAIPHNRIPRELEFPGIPECDDRAEIVQQVKTTAGQFNSNGEPSTATDREEPSTPTPARKR